MKRVCIARAMAIKPKILILDETLSSLDGSLVMEFLELLRQLKGEISIFLITHDVRLVKLVCDRVLVIDNGEIVECASGRSELKKRDWQKAY